MWSVILAAGLLSLIGLMRAGSIVFWNATPGVQAAGPQGSAGLVAPLALVACGIALAVFAEPVKRYADAAAHQLGDRGQYATVVLGDPHAATTRPFPAGVRTEGARP
jgi:multicomponent K+:H+ antiporter subunit D